MNDTRPLACLPVPVPHIPRTVIIRRRRAVTRGDRSKRRRKLRLRSSSLGRIFKCSSLNWTPTCDAKIPVSFFFFFFFTLLLSLQKRQCKDVVRKRRRQRMHTPFFSQQCLSSSHRLILKLVPFYCISIDIHSPVPSQSFLYFILFFCVLTDHEKRRVE